MPSWGSVGKNVFMARKGDRLEPRKVQTENFGGKYKILTKNVCKEVTVCKYLNLETAEQCIKHGTFRFMEPTSWADPYERMFYCADYKKELDFPENRPKMVAQCITPSTSCEAAWKVYTYGAKEGKKRLCVQFVFDADKLREELAKDIPGGYTIYEGGVTYRLTNTIKKLRTKHSDLFNRFFSSSMNLLDWLSLMLIKRPAYKYENEVRLFLCPQDCETDKRIFKENDKKQSYYDIHIDYDKCLKRIVMDENITYTEMREFQRLCKENDVHCKIKIHGLYDEIESPVFIEESKNVK